MIEFDTVITGAGISMVSPSNLPSGVNLAKSLWEKLYRSCEEEGVKDICEAAEKLLFPLDKSAMRKGLRLESICDVLSRYMPFDDIKEIYKAVGAEKYNFNHAALVRLFPNGQITLNLDTLLEAAGKPYGAAAPFHLHGIWNQSDTIITTIGQYLGGLSTKASEVLSSALRNKRVLVLGYSGADVDVFPLFEQCPPAYIEWIQYYNDKLEPEVEDWKERLEKRNPDSLCIKLTSAQEYLHEALIKKGPLDDELQSLYLKSLVKTGAGPEIPESLFHSTQPHERLLGIAAVLLEIGLCKDAIEVLEKITAQKNHNVIVRDKLMARAYKRMLDYDTAFDMLTRSGSHSISLQKIRMNITEIASLLPHLQKRSHLAYIANSGMILWLGLCQNPTCQKNKYLARVRRAKLNIFSGRLNKALHDFEFLKRDPKNVLMQLMSVGSFVDAVSWRSDILKMMGKYSEAFDSLEKIENTVLVYSNVNQQAFVYYKLSEIRLLAGLGESEAMKSLERANAYLIQNDKLSTGEKKAGLLPVWVLSAYGDIYLPEHASRVNEALKEAETYTSPNGDRYGGTIYYLLHMAERARSDEKYDQCISIVNQIIALEKDKETLPRGYFSERAMAYHIMGMCLCSQSRAMRMPVPSDGMRYLHKALACYWKMGMQSGVARVKISIAEAQGRSISAKVIRIYNETGWKLEAERAANPLKYQGKAWVILA